MIAPGIFQHVAPVGSQYQVESKSARGTGERASLISGSCGYEQNAGHNFMLRFRAAGASSSTLPVSKSRSASPETFRLEGTYRLASKQK